MLVLMFSVVAAGFTVASWVMGTLIGRILVTSFSAAFLLTCAIVSMPEYRLIFAIAIVPVSWVIGAIPRWAMSGITARSPG